MKRLLALLAFTLAASAQLRSADESTASVIIVTGAAGTEDYAADFEKSAARWKTACDSGGARATLIASETSLEDLRKALAAEPQKSAAELWVVLLGHGTFDGKEAKFNLRGDDLAASELATLLKPFDRPLVVVNAFSASGGFLAPLSAPGRVVICATKSGAEQNFARFGKFFSESIADPAADLDKDGQVSLLEAWLAAAQRTAAFYTGEGRLATEHSLLDDNGDKFGTPSDWFKGVRAVKRAQNNAPPDGLRAHQIHLVRNASERSLSPTQRAERDALELELSRLRDTKSSLPEAQYFAELEALLLKLARLYESAEAAK